MIHDRSQTMCNSVPRWPKFHRTSLTDSHFIATDYANVDVVSKAMVNCRVCCFAALPILIERAAEA